MPILRMRSRHFLWKKNHKELDKERRGDKIKLNVKGSERKATQDTQKEIREA